MKTAKLIKDNLEGFVGHAALYKLSNKVTYDDDKTTRFVVCSTANVMFTGMETYMFPADKLGKVLDWLELEGSQRGVVSHEDVLNNIGYTIK